MHIGGRANKKGRNLPEVSTVASISKGKAGDWVIPVPRVSQWRGISVHRMGLS